MGRQRRAGQGYGAPRTRRCKNPIVRYLGKSERTRRSVVTMLPRYQQCATPVIEPMRPTASLRTIALFEALPTAAIVSLDRVVTTRRLAAGETLFTRDDDGDDVYFLMSGSLRIVVYARNGKSVLFRDLAAGEVIGDLAAIDRQPRSASVEARGVAVVKRMAGATFRDVVAREPQVAMALLRRSTVYIRELSDRLYQVSSMAVATRIHAELLRLARESGTTGNRAILDPAPRQIDIAGRIATQREAVSREISQLVRSGLVERRGRQLVIHDVTLLASMIEQADAC